MKSPGTVRVLIVDDLSFMRAMLRDILEADGFVVCAESKNGREALSAFEELRPDIVLLDITMPEMDGITALRKIMAQWPDACVVMCSAIGEQKMIMQAIRLGARDYVVKPFRPQRVLKALKRAVGLETL